MIGKKASVCFAVSLGVLIVSIFLVLWGIPAIISRQIQKNVQLDNSSATFERWRKMPMPMDFKVFVFNVTNPDDINKGSRPKLSEIGPFVYKEYREKTILGYGPNDTIKYTLKKSYFFDQEASGNLTEDDEVTVINFSYVAAILSANSMLPSLVPMINEALEQFFPTLDDPFLRVKVRDLFFDGIFLNCAGNHSALGLVCGKIKAETPPTMRPAEDGDGFYFSMFSHLNRTEAGPYEMIRGRDNIQELGHIVSYNGKSAMTMWGDKYCGMLNGSDSSVFPPVDQSNVPERLFVFEPDVCRSMYVSLVGKRNIFNISAYYYEMSEEVLAAKSANPSNRCFCKRNWSGNHDGCLLMGVLNLQPCQGAPAIASFPHFYQASEELLEYFASGVQPDQEKHKSYVYIDPTTGVILKGLKRLQFNIELRNIESVPQLAKVKTGLFPLLWIEEGATLPLPIVEELRSSHTLLGYLRSLPWVLVAVSIVVAIASAVLVVRSGSVPWPRHNSVSFILRNNVSAQGNKGL